MTSVDGASGTEADLHLKISGKGSGNLAWGKAAGLELEGQGTLGNELSASLRTDGKANKNLGGRSGSGSLGEEA